MQWCECNDVDYVLGLARNERLVGHIEKALHKSHSRYATTGAPSRRFRVFRYRTRTSWSRARRVVAKAEHLAKGPNPRFVVTSLGQAVAGPQRLYEQLYCARGDMENAQTYCLQSSINVSPERTESPVYAVLSSAVPAPHATRVWH